MSSKIEARFDDAKEQYAAIGVDVDAALKTLKKTKISMHCWQGDDVKGFLNPDGELTGGIFAFRSSGIGIGFKALTFAPPVLPVGTQILLNKSAATTRRPSPAKKL